MSKLKAISSGEIYKIIEYEDCYRTDDLYYPKSEADEVLADLEESHKMEVEQLLMEIVELKEERRWRKFSEEKPPHSGIYLVCIAGHIRTLDTFDSDRKLWRNYNPTHWMPLPSAPKEEK